MDTIMKEKITAIFKAVDIEAYIDEVNDDEILISSRIVDMYGKIGATIIFDEVELDKPYTVKFKTLAELQFDELQSIRTALSDLQDDYYVQRASAVSYLIRPIEEEFDVYLELKSHKKQDGSLILEFNCTPMDTKAKVGFTEIEVFKVDNCYISLVNDMDLSRRFGQLIAEKIAGISTELIEKLDKEKE